MGERRGRWRRIVAGAGAFVALAAGCDEQSRVDPQAEVRVHGTVVDVDGDPLASRPVRLGAGVSLGDGTTAVLTLGLACTGGQCTGDVFDATTDASGRYEFVLRGEDTQSSFGEARSVLFTATAPPGDGQVSGAAVSARFRVQVENVALPNLRLHDPGLRISGGGAVDAAWSVTAPGPYTLTFETADTVPVWRVTTAGGTATVDPRVLEDAAGRAVVGGSMQDRIEGSSLAVAWRSPGVPFAAGAGPPPSRGRGCRLLDASGASAAVGRCDLTDGDLGAPALTPPVCPASGPTTACAAATAAVVDLETAVPAELVLVRGCEGGCAVDVSADGSTFRPAGSVSDDFGAVPLDGSVVRAVRVGLGDAGELREVSVWGPRPAEALRPLDRDTTAELREPFGTRRSDGVPAWTLFLAGALLATAMAAVAYAFGRRQALRSTARATADSKSAAGVR